MDGEKVSEGANESGDGKEENSDVSLPPVPAFSSERGEKKWFLCSLWLVSNCSCCASTTRMCDACDSAVTCNGFLPSSKNY